MTKRPFLLIAQVLATLLVASLASPVQARPKFSVESATNPDGSAIRIRTWSNEQKKSRRVDIYYRSHTGDRMKRVARIIRSTDVFHAAGMVHISDWDHDGTHEIKLTEYCGAGPNCDYVLYRIAPSSGQLVELFRGSSAILRYLDGYLVELSRDSCCSWVAAAYPVSRDRTHVESSVAFYAIIRPKELVAQQSQACEFFRTQAPGQQVRIDPPSAALRSLCDLYEERR